MGGMLGTDTQRIMSSLSVLEGVRLGLVVDVNTTDLYMTVKIADLGGIKVKIPFQSFMSPIVSPGSPATTLPVVAAKKYSWGFFTTPEKNVGSYAVIWFYNKEFPIVLGFLPGNYITAVKSSNYTLTVLSPGEMLLKSKTYSSVYLSDKGEVRLSSRNTPANGTTEQSSLSLKTNIETVCAAGNITVTATSGDITINGSSGTFTITGNAVNINSPTGTQNAARKGDTTVVNVTSDPTFMGWVTSVSSALGITPAPVSITGSITTGSSTVKIGG